MKQIKMIIIDDEPIILRGLVETYPWHDMGFEIVGTATKATAGLELIKEKRPQVVLTDIKMNQMTGLMLIDHAKKFNKDIVFIVMSAYKEFEYAKQACDMGVFGYLVKPIEEETLMQTMKSVYEYCESKTMLEIEYDYLKEILLENKGSFQNVITERYLKDEITETAFIKSLERIGKNFTIKNGFIGICIGFDIAYCILNQEEFEAQGFAVFNYLEKYIFERYKGWSFKDGQDKVIFILNMEQEEITEVKVLVDKLVSESRKMTSMEIISVISAVFYGVQGLRLMYTQLQKIYDLACESGLHMLTGNNNIEVENKDHIYPKNEELLIINSIRKGDTKGLKEAYIQFLLDIEGVYKNEYIKKCLQRMGLSVEFFVYDSYGLIPDIKASFDSFYELLPSLTKEKAQDILFEILKRVIEVKNQYSVEKNKRYFSEYIEKALVYIEDNLVDETLSITSVSEYVYLNPVYFGRLFKGALNMSFKQYVLNKRIELAKKKIIEGSSNIVTIGNEVGISNSSYFTQVFKKITGYLPSEYKKEMVDEIS